MNIELLEKLKVKPIPQKSKKVGLSIKPKIIKPKESLEQPVPGEISDPPDKVDESEIVDPSEESEIDKKIVIPPIGTSMPVKININIKDKTQDKIIDREEILKKIKQNTKPSLKFLPELPIDLKKKSPIQEQPKIFFIKKKDIKVKLMPKKPSIILKVEKEEETPVKPKNLKEKSKPEETIIDPLEILEGEIIKRIPSPEIKIIQKVPAYYMNNRQNFINFINNLFEPYKKELESKLDDYSCDKSGDNNFKLLIHQKIVRDYINLITPYRGLLLYHGLGSGKTCSSIAIAEGLKTDKQIIVLLPKSLETNYIEELKKCGDILYRKNQYWEYINIKDNPQLIESLSSVLRISVEFIEKNGGAWFINKNIKESNYDQLPNNARSSLNKQLDLMIQNKYKFIAYNGLSKGLYNKLTLNETINPFENKVVIIDEAHNFISMIVNKLKYDLKDKPPNSISTKLYDLLMKAENTRIVLLTGTPIINYPNEIGVMMNILRGNIKVWYFKLIIKQSIKISKAILLEKIRLNLKSKYIFDLLEYDAKSNILTITRNPYYFYSIYNESDNYKGVSKQEGYINDEQFVDIIISVLNEIKIECDKKSVSVEYFSCLPDTLDNFISEFLDIDPATKKPKTVRNMEKFKKRILGLTSYFPDIEELLPYYNKEDDFIKVNIDMSDPQFKIYERARVDERRLELQNSKKRRQKAGSEVYQETTSTYRIFSRLFCNFVFPEPDIKRPLPNSSKDLKETIKETEDEFTVSQSELDTKNDEDFTQEDELEDIVNEIGESKKTATSQKKIYNEELRKSILELSKNKDKYLDPESLKILSPKFLAILTNIQDESNIGLHLMYSQFKTGEGISIFTLVLQANGFTQFKIKKDGEWKLDIPIEDMGKPKYVLYTGSESREEKELYRNIFNGDWDNIPISLREELNEISSNNLYGEIIKLIMITASGAEGISLKNVRFVHITEPYWHNIRLQQIIGRARRICSHKNLPKELQTVKVYLYLMQFTEKQLANNDAQELKAKDGSKIQIGKYLTSDEALYELASIKEKINIDILKNVREAAIDCNIHDTYNKKDGITCLSFGTSNSDKFSYYPSISQDESDEIAKANMATEVIEAVEINLPKHGLVAIEKGFKEKPKSKVFNLEEYKKGNIRQIGTLLIEKDPNTGKSAMKYSKI